MKGKIVGIFFVMLLIAIAFLVMTSSARSIEKIDNNSKTYEPIKSIESTELFSQLFERYAMTYISADGEIIWPISGASSENVAFSDPTCEITNPDDGDRVSGTVTITADASDDVGVSKVTFGINGSEIGYDDSAPYMYNWDTTTYSDNEWHTITATAYDNEDNTGSDSINVYVDDPIFVKDQFSVIEYENTSVMLASGTNWDAQSFKPSRTPLAKIEIFGSISGDFDDYIVISIRENLDEEDLTLIRVHSSELSHSPRFIEFDFPDIEVVIDQTYYLVFRIENEQLSDVGLGLYFDMDYEIDFYERGCMWTGESSGTYWNDHPCGSANADFWFRTYCIDNPPMMLEINGPTSGEPGILYEYNFISIDPDGDKVEFIIYWGDGTNDWLNLSLNYTVSVMHRWEEKGTYAISACVVDSYHAISEYITLEVSMPKNKPYINTPFLNFLENHPHMFPLLRQLLNLQ